MNKALPLHLSELALQEVKKIMQHKGIPEGYSLRIGVRGGGCGASFILGFDTPKPSDENYEASEISILIDKRHLMYVIGLEIDFEDTEQGLGFTFFNPNASNTIKN
jgi:iron-sulfur cluster assembly protein